jgi:hypothetical protein
MRADCRVKLATAIKEDAPLIEDEALKAAMLSVEDEKERPTVCFMCFVNEEAP